MTELELDVSKHILVPKHEKLSEEEAKGILTKYNTSEKRLPRILNTDPALRGLDAEIGDIIRITRKSQTVGTTFYYRVVV
ncbi:DNA-directed RNA polymerase subunit H [archaeon]|jgi:DNA-directed RNA polymerase subunit H|nr:DNA-directed RNA polymerase subunit H [archaeon]MBT3731122.1 DNA-directed RNA polymerase subunit H [archaeon]MBT4670235.1 DNA-directed RNA polymerase subunit H [archaeon]MBT5030476.1 DNA-directed RNA polymerase subunit H [archaeon]MBT5287829.1 DNA-directed RNA polymerase subunit H [archaeon]